MIRLLSSAPLDGQHPLVTGPVQQNEPLVVVRFDLHEISDADKIW